MSAELARQPAETPREEPTPPEQENVPGADPSQPPTPEQRRTPSFEALKETLQRQIMAALERRKDALGIASPKDHYFNMFLGEGGVFLNTENAEGQLTTIFVELKPDFLRAYSEALRQQGVAVDEVIPFGGAFAENERQYRSEEEAEAPSATPAAAEKTKSLPPHSQPSERQIFGSRASGTSGDSEQGDEFQADIAFVRAQRALNERVIKEFGEKAAAFNIYAKDGGSDVELLLGRGQKEIVHVDWPEAAAYALLIEAPTPVKTLETKIEKFSPPPHPQQKKPWWKFWG